MGEVRKEIGYLMDFLDSNIYYDKKWKKKIPVTLHAFVDDLGRCTSKTIFDALECIHLM